MPDLRIWSSDIISEGKINTFLISKYKISWFHFKKTNSLSFQRNNGTEKGDLIFENVIDKYFNTRSADDFTWAAPISGKS